MACYEAPAGNSARPASGHRGFRLILHQLQPTCVVHGREIHSEGNKRLSVQIGY